MIAVQKISDRIDAKLDATGSQRYLFDLDKMPAINGAMEILVTALNSAFGENKLAPECLRDLTNVKIWQTNQYSRVSYSSADTGAPLWTILAVYPKPKVNKGVAAIPLSDPSVSKFRPELSFIKSNYACKRLTLEEWNENNLNVFMPGNSILTGSLIEYAYLDMADYTSTSYAGNPGQKEITIRPEIPGQLVAIAFLSYPNQVTSINDSIEFPESLTELITDIACNLIATKQGDRTSLYSITTQQMSFLLNALQ